MCPNDTVFDQENFICANWFEIDCRSSTLFYDKNLQLFRQPEGSAASGGTSTTEEPSDQQRKQQEQQLKQLQVLEEQQAAQVFRQQQVLEQHEKRQQEHQVINSLNSYCCDHSAWLACPFLFEMNSLMEKVAEKIWLLR